MPDKKIEIIKKHLESLTDKPESDALLKEKAVLLNDLAAQLNRSDPQQAEKYACESLSLSQDAGLFKESADSYSIIGTSYWVRGDYQRAQTNYEKSLEICQKTGDKKGASAYLMNIGLIHKDKGNLELALDHYFKALKIKEEFHDKHGSAKCFNNIGIIYDEIGNHKLARSYYTKAFEVFKELGDKQGLAFCCNNIGITYEAQDDYDRALVYYLKSLKLKQELEDNKGIASSLLNIGTLYEKYKDFRRLLEYSKKALAIFEQINDKRGIADSVRNIGRAHCMLEEYDSARTFLEKGLKLAKELEAKDLEIESYKALSDLYEANNNCAEALEYFKSYSNLKEEMFSLENASKFAQLQIQFETEKKEKEAEIYRLKNVELQKEIDSRKQAEKELRESSSKNEALLAALPDLMFVITVDGVVEDFKVDNEQDLAISSGALRGKNISEAGFSDEQLEFIFKQIEETVKTKKMHSFEYELEINSELNYYDARIVPFGQRSILATVRNITNRRRAEQELRKLQNLESIGLLAGGIAHDFNNILTSLFGNMSLAREKLPGLHPAQKSLDNAENSLSRATSLTRQLLTFAQGGDPVREDVSLKDLVKEITEFDLTGSKIRPVFSFSDDLYKANVDVGQIQQVVSNLVINASQATPNGGRLYISLENADSSENTEPDLKTGSYVRLVVQDEGTGIDRKYLDRIFDPYFTTKQKGSGLGLATVYSIIKKHGGKINVDSELGKGAKFTIYLPASKSLETQDISKPDFAKSKISKKAKILVMDDEGQILETVKEMLKLAGFSVETARDGGSAIELYINAGKAGEPFDLAIIDLTVPGGMGGKDAIKELAAIDPNVKAIVFSGYSTDPIIMNYEEYGFKGRLAKPFKMQELLNEVVRVLDID